MNKKFLIAASVMAVILVVIGLNKSGTSVSEQKASVSTANEKEENEKLVALSTFTILSDMVSEVGGDKVESISLTKPGVDIHNYEPTPSDLIRASKADILFENGMNLELWTDKLRTSIPDVPTIVVSDRVEELPIAEGVYEGKPNPHAWMSPKQGLIYIENIRRALVEARPEHEAYFNANAESYSSELMSLDNTLAEALEKLPDNNRHLVTCEGAFTYLTNDYGLNEIYIWAINDESGGSPQQVAATINQVKENNVPAVFCESTVEPRIQSEVAKATGAKLGGVLYVDSLSTSDGPAPTYLALLEHTVDVIIEGLTK